MSRSHSQTISLCSVTRVVGIVMVVFALTTTGGDTELPASRPPRHGGPSVVLAHPASGVALTKSRPLVVFRFTADAEDPIDRSSFRATVDGVDRTALFRVMAAEAWAGLGGSLGAGAHVITARICVVSGPCTAVTEVVVVDRTSPAAPRGASWRRPLLADAAGCSLLTAAGCWHRG